MREPDGLALSSRNVRLSAAERAAALVLCAGPVRRARAVGARASGGPARWRRLMAAVVATEPLAALDYAAAVDAATLAVPPSLDAADRGAAAGGRPGRAGAAHRQLPRPAVGPHPAVGGGGPGAGRGHEMEDAVRRRMMKSKIHRATVTAANLNYVGSVSIDTELMALADILPYEQVAVLDIDNGARFETYAIEGGTGEICLNGAAARLVSPGDRVILITYADYSPRGARALPAPGGPRRPGQPGHRRGLGPPGRRAGASIGPA